MTYCETSFTSSQTNIKSDKHRVRQTSSWTNIDKFYNPSCNLNCTLGKRNCDDILWNKFHNPTMGCISRWSCFSSYFELILQKRKETCFPLLLYSCLVSGAKEELLSSQETKLRDDNVIKESINQRSSLYAITLAWQ